MDDNNKDVDVFKLILLLLKTIIIYLSALFLITYLLERYANIVLVILTLFIILILYLKK